MSLSPINAPRSSRADPLGRPNSLLGLAASGRLALAAALLALFLAGPALARQYLPQPDLAQIDSRDLTTAMARKPSSQEGPAPAEAADQNPPTPAPGAAPEPTPPPAAADPSAADLSAVGQGAQSLTDGLAEPPTPQPNPVGLNAVPLPAERPLVFEIKHKVPRPLVGKSCTVKFAAVGDILIHDTMRKYSLKDDGSYDFKPNLRYVQPLLAKSDLVIGNLENPLAGAEKRLTGYPNFNAPQELAADLKEIGFTTVLISNNHSMDRGWPGLETTIETVERAGLDYAGGYSDPEDKRRRLISVYNGVKIALLAYTYGLNGYPGPKSGEEWRLGVIDRQLIWNDMRSVQEEGADFIIVSLHFGNEYQRKPNAEQLKLVGELLAGDPTNGLAGADLILGHHPHVVQPFVQVDNGPGLPGQAVIYSLGNFMTSQPFAYTYLGLILEGELTVTPDGQKILGPFTLIPTYCHKGVKDGKRVYRVIPLALAANDPQSYDLTPAMGANLAKTLKEMNAHLVSMEPDSSKWPNFK
ncbi:MAG: CapA family protein [Deltaproteobacteria bacterium]|jgi:poly-gamma-glutamate synthesis protein (capsule biosynthesis protein)|nr:CapA family protein [Deltaproteobacteria bacterium]